jgi:branched-chain amino acid aminotransferase
MESWVKQMTTRVSIDGALFDEKTAAVPVFDRGFLYGDSVFESLRTAGGRPVDGARHLERLARSAATLGFAATPTDLVAAELAAVLAAAAHPEAYVRVMLTRGDGPIGLDPALAGAPRRVIIVQPLRLPAPEVYERGVRAVIAGLERVSARALDPSVKSGNYLNSVLAVAEARARGADEAILCNPAGAIAEGAAANVFVVRGGRVQTPPAAAGLLPGITRRRVLELCAAAGLPADETELTPDALRGADEVFLTSSIRGLVPVTTVDDRAVAGGRPGPVTIELRRRYDAFVAEVAAGETSTVG